MTSIIGIPTTRVSDSFVRSRLMAQVQFDQRELFRLETQLSTGRRFEMPSDEPVAALRIMSLQRLLERKEQVQTNLHTNQAFMTSTDTALSRTSGLLAEARGTALSVMGSTASDEQRRTAAQQISQTLLNLIDTGNQKFRGRYLFSGSITDQMPFEVDSRGNVVYRGNDAGLESYADVDLLFQSNLTGVEVFGAWSDPVGGNDLRPVITNQTRLASLNGGMGIPRGSILISDGTTTKTIDLSQAETLEDVALAIRANPPDGKEAIVEITATGLTIRLQPPTGNLMILENPGGNTAQELGILAVNGVGGGTVIGSDLNPVLLSTTRLDDLLGARARACVHLAGSDNDLVIEANANGSALNGMTVELVDDPAIPVDGEYAEMVGSTIRVHIREGNTRAWRVRDEINELGLDFTARLDPLDEQAEGQGIVTITNPPLPTMSGGVDGDFDRSGIQIVNGGQTFTITFGTAKTIEDVLNAINGAKAGVLASLDPDRNGIEIRSRISGADFAIGENGGQTATQLGLRTFGAATALSTTNFGYGVPDVGDGHAVDFTITRADGTVMSINVTGAKTIGDVIATINAANGTHPQPLVAQVAEYGNGIELVDPLGDFTITRVAESLAAVDLGLMDRSETEYERVITGGHLVARDTAVRETEGLFTALLRLKNGLIDNDLKEIERAVGLLDDSMLDLNFARADLGARQQGLDVLKERLDGEEIELRSVLSQDYDVDIAEVISNLTGRQVAMEAAMRATGMIFQMTLLNFL